MSNNWSRYTWLYRKVPRPNSVTPFPKHVFMRAQNKFQHKQDRLGDRDSCFETTFVHLTERFNNTELFLIGTMNSSTMLANRTKKLIEDINPDTVLVQCSKQWWDTAKLIQDVNSQEEFNTYHDEFLSDYDHFHVDTSTFRSVVFWTRMYMLKWFLKYKFYVGNNFLFYVPGLEVKYA